MKKNLSLLVLTLIAFSFATANAARLNLNCTDSRGTKVANLKVDVQDSLLERVEVGEFKKNPESYTPTLVSFRLTGLDKMATDSPYDIPHVITLSNAQSSHLQQEELKNDAEPEGLDLSLNVGLREPSDGPYPHPYEDEIYQLAQLTLHNFLNTGYVWDRRSAALKLDSVSVDPLQTLFATLTYTEGGMDFTDEWKLLCESKIAKK